MTSAVASVTSDVEASPLTQLAQQIEAKHQAVLRGLRQNVHDAREVGELLNHANGLVPYGQWRRWVDTNCTFSYETATAYRRIATRSAELPTVVLTITEALKILSELTNPKPADLQPTAGPHAGNPLVFPDEKIESTIPEELQLQLVDPSGPAAHTDLITDQKLLMVAETIRTYTMQDVIVRRVELIQLREAIDVALAKAAAADPGEALEAEELCAR